MAKIHFHTLGCRLNQAESERLAQAFRMAGHEVVQDPGAADLKVINTCTVTRSAGAKSRRAAHPSREGQHLVVTGCHSQVHPAEFPRDALLVTNEQKDELAALAMEKFGLDGPALGMDFRRSGPLHIFPLVLDHTRAFVKIQDGCNLRCTFCMTTLARGASYSRPAGEIVEEIRSLAAQGCREAVLTGVHAGAYRDGPSQDLGTLLARILEETPIGRVRLSSLEPWNFKPHWAELWSRYEGRICRHLHMSLQSGSASVLKRMARVYDPSFYAGKISFLREHIPGLAVTTDIIVGFPGETEGEHQESLAFVEQMAFADAHIFSFSPRPGTEAATMPDQVPANLRHQRYKEMRAVTNRCALAFREHRMNEPARVLWEHRQPDGSIVGLTDHYLQVKSPDTLLAPNTFSDVILSSLDGDVFCAEIPGHCHQETAGIHSPHG